MGLYQRRHNKELLCRHSVPVFVTWVALFHAVSQAMFVAVIRVRGRASDHRLFAGCAGFSAVQAGLHRPVE